MSITVHFVSLSVGKTTNKQFHSSAISTVGLCRTVEGVFTGHIPKCVCICVFELLTEVTLGLFLHSGDGTVLVCEEKLLELGHLIL